MNTEEKVSQAVQHIENHLLTPLCSEEIAGVAKMSLRSLQRNFTDITGDTVQNYIRDRRLTQASVEIVTKQTSVLETALNYQFESYEGFSRAFKRRFLLSPEQFRKVGSPYNALQKPSLSPDKQHNQRIRKPQTPQITLLPAKKMVGIKTIQPHYAFSTPENKKACKKIKNELRRNKDLIRHIKSDDEWSASFRTSALDSFHEIEKLYCFEVNELEDYSGDFTGLVVPQSLYMVLDHNPQEPRERTINTAFNWLKKSRYFLGNAPCMFKQSYNNVEKQSLFIPVSEQKPECLSWWRDYDLKMMRF